MIHELGHHHGEEDHSYLDILGKIVAQRWMEGYDFQLKNGSFEKSAANGKGFEGWIFAKTGNAMLFADMSRNFRGEKTAVVIHEEKQASSHLEQCISLTQDKYFKPFTVSVSAVAIGELEPGARSRMLLRQISTDNKIETFSETQNNEFSQRNLKNPILEENTGLKALRLEVPLHKNTKQVCVLFATVGKGRLYIDDVKMEFQFVR